MMNIKILVLDHSLVRTVSFISSEIHSNEHGKYLALPSYLVYSVNNLSLCLEIES